MIRFNKLIKKSNIFDYLQDPNVASVCLFKHDNKALIDPELCRVKYHTSLSASGNELKTLVDNITKIVEYRRANNIKWCTGNSSFTSGIRSCKQTQFINYSDLIRLYIVEVQEGISFDIPPIFAERLDAYYPEWRNMVGKEK